VLTVVLREKNCGWRIDVFYANEGMMKDVISSDILSDVPRESTMSLNIDHGIRSLSYFVNFKGYHKRSLPHSARSRKSQESD